jgi:hypothetical protein
VTRGVDELLADLAEAIDAAAELVNLGRTAGMRSARYASRARQ